MTVSRSPATPGTTQVADARYEEPRARDGVSVERRPWEALTADTDEGWLARTRVVLQPTAAPSIMGLFGFAVATIMVGAWMAGWYGNASTPTVIWPLSLFAGGVLQIIAAAACYRARDGLGLAVHSIWGAFWLGWSVLELFVTVHLMSAVPLGAVQTTLGFWFIVVGLVTASATFAAGGRSLPLTATLACLATASGFAAAAYFAGALWLDTVAGWLFVGSALGAWLVATAMLMESTFGRTIIPLGRYSADSNIPGHQDTRPIQRPTGMPGLRAGQ